MKTIESWLLKATHPTATNDPLEFIAQNEKVNYVAKIRNPAMTLPYFHSFSSKVTDVAMWGRYADSSRGVCLAFCFPTETEVSMSEGTHSEEYERCRVVKAGWIHKVKYAKQRIYFPRESEDPEERKEALYRMLTTKALCWKDECEYRFIDELRAAKKVMEGMALYEKYMPHLCGVILGERCDYNRVYTEMLFKQYRKSKKSSVYVQDTCLSDVQKIEFPIKFERASVDDIMYEIGNPVFEDNMTLKRYLEKVPEAKILDI